MIKRLFGAIKTGFGKFDKKLASKSKILAEMAKNDSLRTTEVLLIIVVILGITTLVLKFFFPDKLHKIIVTADTGPSLFATNKHYSTIINATSLNELAPPTTEAEWNWEKDHYDAVIASYHAKGIYDRNRTDVIKTNLTRYMLINTTESSLDQYMNIQSSPNQASLNTSTYKNFQEAKDMHDFCTGTGTMPDGYPKPGLSESQFEDAFLHFSNDTVVDNLYTDPNSGVTSTKPTIIKGFGSGTAAERSESRMINNIKYGYFYVLNHKSQCTQKYKAYMVYRTVHDPQPAKNADGSDNIADAGVIYDGVFVDDFYTGSLINMRPITSGGSISEYGDKTRDQIDTTFAADQATNVGFIKNDVAGRIGHDFLMTLNSAEANYANSPYAAPALAAGGVTTEMFSSEGQFSGLGKEYYNWQWGKYATDNGAYFIWAQREADSEFSGNSIYNYTASNYSGAPSYKLGGWQSVVVDNTGKEARHDMASLVSYLIAKDRNNKMIYSQRGWGNDSWDVPASEYWMKAREMNIGQPTTDQYAVVQTDNDTQSQPYIMYRRDYDNAVALIREYNGYPPAGYWDMGAQSQSYEIDPTNHTAYRVVYPDGTLSPSTYTSITLAYGEGVVLVPDGYDPMSGNVTQSDNAQITLTNGGTHTVGDTFNVTANINTNGNKVCAAEVHISYPTDKLTIQNVTAGSIFNQAATNSNSGGVLTYSVGAPNCTTTSNTDLFTIQFRAIGAGSGNIDIASAIVAGGESTETALPITTDLQGTTFDISEAPQIKPITLLSITNGATKNQNDYYNQFPVIKLDATTTSPGATIASITYKIDGGSNQVVNSASASNIQINSDGTHTITYFATDSNGIAEDPITEEFKIDTAAKPKPVVDPYNQDTYKAQFNITGTKTNDILTMYVNKVGDVLSSAGVNINGNNWSKIVDLQVISGAPDQFGKKVKPTTFIATGEDIAGNKSTSDPINITRHNFADINGDMIIGTGDVASIMANWGNLLDYMADLDYNGTCDIFDFAILMANWNEPI